MLCSFSIPSPIPFVQKKREIPDIRLRWIAGTSVNCETLIEETKEPDKETDESKKVTNTRERVFRSNVMTHAQQELTGIIKLILLTLKSKDHMEYVKTGVRKYFIVDSVDEVIQRIKSNYPEFLKYAEPKTYDFTTMYSNLKHKVLKRNCKEAVDEAFRFSGKKHFPVRNILHEIAEHVESPRLSFSQTELMQTQRNTLPK